MAANAAARAAGDGSADSGCSGGGSGDASTRPRLRSRTGRPPHVRGGVVSSRAVQVVAVVPTYNEVDNLEALVRRLREAVPDIDVLVVDDDSPDGTAELAEKLAAEHGRIDVLVRDGRRGLGSAYREGFRRAIDGGAEICVQIDADLSHDPADLPALLANVEHGADLAIGSRYVPGGRTESWSWRRRWLSRWGNRYAAGVLGLAVNDATAGYRAYRADVARGDGLRDGHGRGLRLPDRDDPPARAGRRQDRRVPDRLPRPRGR